MKRMISILVILILCLSLCIACSKGGLVGKWEEQNMGSVFVFKRNGDLLVGDSEWTYRLEGTYLVLCNEKGEEGYYKYQIQGDTMTLQDENGMFTFNLVRVEE